jgi:hypothetical protein
MQELNNCANLDDAVLLRLIEFFLLLDKWDQQDISVRPTHNATKALASRLPHA